MENFSDDYLLMIEPDKEDYKKDETKHIETHSVFSNCVVWDDLTRTAESVFEQAEENRRFRGVYQCICGEMSDNIEWVLPTGHITNSLMIHYISSHRPEVPKSEIKKLKSIADELDCRHGVDGKYEFPLLNASLHNFFKQLKESDQIEKIE
jgi:hypothetical protein